MTSEIQAVEVMKAIARTSALLARSKGRQGGIKGTSFVLSYLLSHERGIVSDAMELNPNQSKIAEECGITPQSVGSLISSLESKGFVERVPSESDRRSMRVVLTDKGRREAEAIQKDQREFAEQALSCLDASEKRELLGLLDKISDSLSAK